jgi:hypothetical protein
MTVRNYINGAQLLTLSVAVNTTDVTLTVSSTAGYPTAPFTMALERATANEEVVLCTAKTANTFTVTRGWDGTTGKNHSIGAAVEHTTAAIDYVEANTHVNDNTNDVHTQYVRKAAYSAKGAIVIGTGVGAIAALAVGADNTVHMADAAQATGTKWGTLVAASITDGVITEAKLTTSAQQSLIARQSGAPTAVNGREYFDTSDNRPRVYVGAWYKKAFGVGFITYSTGAPSGGLDGDVWLRYV